MPCHPSIVRYRHLPALLGVLLTGISLAAACADPASTNPPPPPPAEWTPTAGLELVEVTRDLTFPVDLAAPPGDMNRLFVVEKSGTIRIIRDGVLLPGQFLDISANVSRGTEQGLLGLAFAPDYATSGLFVIHYTDPSGDTRVSSLRVSANPDQADPTSEQVILQADQPFGNHNGGTVAFGPDGMLYIALGDGGSGGDPQNNAQDLGSLLGKLLRLALQPDGTVRVPADNPFVGQAGRRPEIWSYGLRNPWRFSFDTSTGDLYIGDVGQNAFEEVNVAAASGGRGRGNNFGWRLMEGFACYNPASGCDQTGLTLPTLAYGRDEGCSVTGGYVYRGNAIPAMDGQYFFSDYCHNWLRSFRFEDGKATMTREWTNIAPTGRVATFGVDGLGQLYLGTEAGRVYRVASLP